MKTQIQGSLVALVTPMFADERLDMRSFDLLLEWHIESGTNGIVVVGTTGESATLSAEEHCDLVERAVEVVAGRVPVIAGTGSNSTTEALYFTEAARKHGADAALLVTPYYNKPSQEGLFQHFRKIAEEVDIPQILYNVPGRTVCDMSLETVQRLADLDNIVGIKDATGDLQRGLDLIAQCPNLAVYSGEDALARELILGGAKGVISVTANVVPKLMVKMCSLALAGDEAGAANVDAQLEGLHSSLFLEANPIPVKWALEQMGMVRCGLRLPLTELDEQFRVQVREALLKADVKLQLAA